MVTTLFLLVINILVRYEMLRKKDTLFCDYKTMVQINSWLTPLISAVLQSVWILTKNFKTKMLVFHKQHSSALECRTFARQ